MTDTNKERAEFEAWTPTIEGYPFARQFANLMWKSYQAGRAANAPAAPTQAEFALRALVAAGFVTQAKVDEALTLPGAPPAAEPVAEVKELFIPATGATAKAAHLMDTSLPGGSGSNQS